MVQLTPALLILNFWPSKQYYIYYYYKLCYIYIYIYYYDIISTTMDKDPLEEMD